MINSQTHPTPCYVYEKTFIKMAVSGFSVNLWWSQNKLHLNYACCLPLENFPNPLVIIFYLFIVSKFTLLSIYAYFVTQENHMILFNKYFNMHIIELSERVSKISTSYILFELFKLKVKLLKWNIHTKKWILIFSLLYELWPIVQSRYL